MFLKEGITVLIMMIDDDSFTHRMAGFMMKKLGQELICASSGAEGLDMLLSGETKPAVLFIDNEMPGMSGIETIAKTRETEAVKDLNICLMTGTLTEELRGQAAQLGVTDCISKPLNAADVKAVIDKAAR